MLTSIVEKPKCIPSKSLSFDWWFHFGYLNEINAGWNDWPHLPLFGCHRRDGSSTVPCTTPHSGQLFSNYTGLSKIKSSLNHNFKKNIAIFWACSIYLQTPHILNCWLQHVTISHEISFIFVLFIPNCRLYPQKFPIFLSQVKISPNQQLGPCYSPHCLWQPSLASAWASPCRSLKRRSSTALCLGPSHG